MPTVIANKFTDYDRFLDFSSSFERTRCTKLDRERPSASAFFSSLRLNSAVTLNERVWSFFMPLSLSANMR